jgi:prevent-host-death family protein
MPIIEARNKLTSLPEELEQAPEIGAVAVTRRGKPVLAVMSWEMYESLLETMEILGDDKMMSAFRQSVKEEMEGRGIPWDKVKRKLKL